MSQYGYQQYKQQSINTMTQGELLILLYDELLKRLGRAEIALKEKDYGTLHQAVTRCREIVKYLMETLDGRYEISQEIRRLYWFFDLELAKLDAGRREQVIHELKPLILELRNAFKEADRIAANQ